jgi:hypothetical protein
MAGMLATVPARADRVSVGVGLSTGNGFLTLGINQGGHGHFHRPRAFHPRHPLPRPRPIGVLPPPVVVVPPPVVVAPAPVMVRSGYWQEREERYWVEGCWIETLDTFGRRCKQWQPGHWEVRRIREWVY